MEKRILSFALASLVVVIAFTSLQQAILGPRLEEQQLAQQEPIGEDEAAPVAVQDDKAKQSAKNDGTEEAKSNRDRTETIAGDRDELDARDADQPIAQRPADDGDEQLIMLGSLDPESPYQMLVTFSNRGACVQRVELNRPKYTDLMNEAGYLGNLSLMAVDNECIIRTVAPGSPAAAAGLRGREWTTEGIETSVTYSGDILKSIAGQDVESIGDYQRILAKTKPGQSIEVQVERDGKTISRTIELAKCPLQLIQPEPLDPTEEEPQHPFSFLMTLYQIGSEQTRFDANELAGIPSFYDGLWSVELLAAAGEYGPGVEFRRTLTADELARFGAATQLDVVKRFRLATVDRSGEDKLGAAGYRLAFELEVLNNGDESVEVGYQLDGPTGLTPEGWWYSYKVHPTKMSVAGARDVVWRQEDAKHLLFVCGGIADHRRKNPDSPDLPLVDSTEPVELAYVGTDAQYFSAIMISDDWDKDARRGEPGAKGRLYDAAFARAVGPDSKKRRKYTDVSTRIKSRPKTLGAGESLDDSFTIFLGPKEPKVLAEYGLDECIVYGWFWWVAKPMRAILHGFYLLTGKFSYGLAIILLTVLVRAMLFPFGRKMAKNAQKMQELVPEMKKIADKYKDVEKRSKAQQELFKQHNYNPLSGCLVLFIQTPVFLGLYRCIGTDISLRQAPLIPGLTWCSNLAGPDRFWNWENTIPAALASTTGWLGPYLNLLPLVAVGLILAQQKLFTPPPQDEQQQMQQSVMKFMMIFMCMIFFKFAAGLCLYIIVSTLWGLGERLLLPKSGTVKAEANLQPVAVASGNASNGASKKRRNKKSRKR